MCSEMLSGSAISIPCNWTNKTVARPPPSGMTWMSTIWCSTTRLLVIIEPETISNIVVDDTSRGVTPGIQDPPPFEMTSILVLRVEPAPSSVSLMSTSLSPL